MESEATFHPSRTATHPVFRAITHHTETRGVYISCLTAEAEVHAEPPLGLSGEALAVELSLLLGRRACVFFFPTPPGKHATISSNGTESEDLKSLRIASSVEDETRIGVVLTREPR